MTSLFDPNSNPEMSWKTRHNKINIPFLMESNIDQILLFLLK